MRQVSRIHVEVDFSGEPLFADFAEKGGDETEQRRFVWKEGGDTGSAPEFLIDAFDGVACAHPALVGSGEGEDRKALGDVCLHPGGKFRSRLGVGLHQGFEAGLGGGEIRAVEDGTDIGRHAGTHVQTGDVSLGVLLEMELAALPGNGGEDGSTGGREAAMGVADNEGESVKASSLERGKEGTPVDLRFTERSADTEDGSLAIRADSDGDEDRTVQELATLADLFVSGVQDQIGAAAQRVIPPGLKFGIELGGASADLSGTNGMPAEFLDDFGDFSGGDALDIHLGKGEQEGLFAAGSFFQSTRVKIHAVANLRDAQLDGTDTGGQSLGFEAIGTSEPILATLVGAGLKDSRAFLNHGFVDEQAQALGKTGGALRGEELQNGVQKIRINLVGHVWVFVGCVCCTPTGNHTGQPPANFAQAPSGAGCARLATLAFAPPPPDGALRSRRTQLQKKLYTPQQRVDLL